jgi:mRNA-degrading endonuclease RelE of RelBE toxin-antitoxin system
VISPYVLIYDFDSSSDTATVLRIVHGRRNITVDLIRRR